MTVWTLPLDAASIFSANYMAVVSMHALDDLSLALVHLFLVLASYIRFWYPMLQLPCLIILDAFVRRTGISHWLGN